jgi:tetratricopeptide (TPR) repeat protein
LGVVLKRQNRSSEAVSAYRKGSEADPKLASPYVRLAALTANQGLWQDTLQASAQAIKLAPLEFPDAFFYHAAANYNLGRLGEAEASSRRAVELDVRSRLPRARLLLAQVLERKGDTRAALAAYREYLNVAPQSDAAQANDLIRVKRRIEELERM